MIKHLLMRWLLTPGEMAMIFRLRNSAKLTERINNALDWSEGQWTVAETHTLWSIEACTRFAKAAEWTPADMESAEWWLSLNIQQSDRAKKAVGMSHYDWLALYKSWQRHQERKQKKGA